MDQYLEKYIKDNYRDYSNATALDLGCGKGYDVACLRHLGFRADGVDRNDCDLNCDYKGKFLYDLVYSNYVLPFIKNYSNFANIMAKNLVDNGKIFIATFSNKDEILGGLTISKEELVVLFSKKFEYIKIDEYHHYDNSFGHAHFHELLILTAKKRGE